MKNKIDTRISESEFIEKNGKYHLYYLDDPNIYNVSLHEHGFMEFFFFVSGSIAYTIDEGNYKLNNFDIVIVPTHTLHQIKMDNEKTPFKRYVLWIYPSFIKSISSEITDLTKNIFKFSLNKNYIIRNPELFFSIKPHLDMITNLYDKQEFAYDVLAENALRNILITINKYLENDISHPKPDGNDLVLKVINYIEENISQELSIDSIAKHFDVEGTYISYIFNKEVGTTLHKYIVKKRLSFSRQMLEDGLKMDTIVKRIGFKDTSHFIQSFRKEYGVTPLKYRKSAR